MITGTANQNPDPIDSWITCPHCTEEHHINKECNCQQIEWKLCPICEWEHQEEEQICSDCSKH